MDDPPERAATPAREISFIRCFLCGGRQIYPGPRYEAHLMNEHGVLDIDFMIRLSLYKEKRGCNPDLQDQDRPGSAASDPQDKSGSTAGIEAKVTVEAGTQTEGWKPCTKCCSISGDDVDNEDFLEKTDRRSQGRPEMAATTLAGAIADIKAEPDLLPEPETLVLEEPNLESEDEDEEYLGNGATEEPCRQPAKSGSLPKEDDPTLGEYRPVVPDRKRAPTDKGWAPNSFSSTFTCYFCNENFGKDYKLKLHLMLNHKGEDPAEMAKAKEVLTKSKLDGCVHRCALCGSRYNSVANFTRHIKDVHQISRAEYREEYGSSEVVSRMFRCELCDKEVKHTRNIIGAHMKMVHLISWKEYQEILVKLRQGVRVGDLPAPELFECIICGVSVKYRREHLNKKHQISEDMYNDLLERKNRGEDIAGVVPEREIHRCFICDRECMDLRKHLDRSHQIDEATYKEMMGEGKAAKQGGLKPEDKRSPAAAVTRNSSGGSSGVKRSSPSVPAATNGKPTASFKAKEVSTARCRICNVDCPDLLRHLDQTHHITEDAYEFLVSNGRASSRQGMTEPPPSETSSALSTDMRCYFGCEEVFRKDFQLHLHLKLKHRDEDPGELRRAYEAADEEIALTRRSGSTFKCALCPRYFNDSGAFYGHIQSKHNMQWKDYKDKHGRCEVESAPFECKICGRVVKYDRNTVHTHLKNVHGITWVLYLDRIRKMRQGQVPDDLPNIETHVCRVCNVSVKYLREHLKNVHKITESVYQELFSGADGPDHPQQQQSGAGKSMGPVRKPPPLEKPCRQDIVDKANKRCSVCNVTLESRRDFIRHCADVHDMKFRTKSGAIISANQQQPQGGLSVAGAAGLPRKRAAASGPLDQFSQPKRSPPPVPALPGAGGSFPGSSNQGVVSKWNQCRYSCVFCQMSSKSRSSMTSHIFNVHGVTNRAYKEANYPDIEVETNWFQCRLCNAKVKFVKDSIAPHLKMCHMLDIETYERKFMLPEDWPQAAGGHDAASPDDDDWDVPHSRRWAAPSPGSLSGVPEDCEVLDDDERPLSSSTASAAGGHHGGSSSNGNVSSVKQARQEEAEKWNKCKYRCSLCNYLSYDHRQVRMHISNQHHLQYDDYCRKYGSTEVVSQRFRCGLCGSEVKFSRQNIYVHMRDVHAISLAEYEARVSKVGGNTGLTTTKAAAAAPAGGSSSLHEGPQVLDGGRQPSRWNKCRFQCALCGKLASVKRVIQEHVVKAHAIGLHQYEAKFGECEVHTELFKCAKCGSEVKHNLRNITLHLNNVHNVSTDAYEKEYGRLPDTPVVTTQHSAIVGGGGGSNDVDVDDDDDPLELLDGVRAPPATVGDDDDEEYDDDEDDVVDHVDLTGVDHYVIDDYEAGGGGPDVVDNRGLDTGNRWGNHHHHHPSGKAAGGNQPHSQSLMLKNPPKCDVQNPSNRYCLPCDREFNRRQAFLLHCRNIHMMKIKFKDSKRKPLSASGSSAASRLALDHDDEDGGDDGDGDDVDDGGQGSRVVAGRYQVGGFRCAECGKRFSSRSNRNRHVLLSCDRSKRSKKFRRDSVKVEEVDGKGRFGGGHGAEAAKMVDRRCPYPDCGVVCGRSALMKRHLLEVHRITCAQDISVKLEHHSAVELERKQMITIKSEPLDLPDGDDVEEEAGVAAAAAGEDKRVPPLKVKILSTKQLSHEDFEGEPAAADVASSNRCASCNVFTSNNSYILGRHLKCCRRKRKLLGEQDVEEDADAKETVVPGAVPASAGTAGAAANDGEAVVSARSSFTYNEVEEDDEDDDEDDDDENTSFSLVVEVPVVFEDADEAGSEPAKDVGDNQDPTEPADETIAPSSNREKSPSPTVPEASEGCCPDDGPADPE